MAMATMATTHNPDDRAEVPLAILSPDNELLFSDGASELTGGPTPRAS